MEIQNYIAEMSMGLSQAELMRGVSTTMLKKAIDSDAQMASQLMETAPAQNVQAFPGDVGSILDIRV